MTARYNVRLRLLLLVAALVLLPLLLGSVSTVVSATTTDSPSANTAPAGAVANSGGDGDDDDTVNPDEAAKQIHAQWAAEMAAEASNREHRVVRDAAKRAKAKKRLPKATMSAHPTADADALPGMAAAGTPKVATRDVLSINEPSVIIGYGGEDDGEFKSPWRTVVLPNGNFLVVDTGNSRLQVFDQQGKFLDTVGFEGDELGDLRRPRDAVVVGNGTLLVVDRFNHRLQLFDADTLAAISVLPISGVLSVAVLPNTHEIVVFETQWHQLLVYSAEGKFLRKIRLPKTIKLKAVDAITVTASGDLILPDTMLHSIFIVSLQGEVLRTIGDGKASAEKGKLSLPYQVAVAPDGKLFVSEVGNNRIQVFSPEGEHLHEFGGPGMPKGQLNYPSGVIITDDYKIVVTDSLNNRVLVF